MNKNTIKKAFTLVELIVVITILAVLATVAFVSFQWYGQSSRDSVRLADLRSMEKVNDLYRLTHSKYPTPNDATWITYSWSTAWTQWVFWTNSYSSNTSLSNVPTDPLSWLPYAYSVTNTKQEYQMAAVLEWEVSNFNTQSYAWDQIASAYIRWDYNGQFIKVSANATNYLLWVPSIIASDITSVDMMDIINNQRLVYKWYNNLPASYSWSIYNNNGWFNFTPNQVILFEWEVSELENELSKRVTFLEKLQANYWWTVIAVEEDIAEILAVDSSSDRWNNIVATSLNNSLKTEIITVKITWNNNWWSISIPVVVDCDNLIWIPLPATQLLSISNYNVVKNFIIPQTNAFEFVPIEGWFGWWIPGLWDPEPTIYHYSLLPIDLCDNTELGFTTVAWETGTGNVQNVYKMNLAEYEEYEIDVTWDIREQILIFDKDANLLISVYDGIPKYTPTYTWEHYIVVASLSGDPFNHWTYNIKVTHNINVAAPVEETF